jgi:uncharacterized protein (TIGR02001 family)
MIKKTLMAGFIATALGSGFAQAQAQAPASPHTITGNVGLFSQYVFRGLSQTNEEPAIQGGFDYSHSSGFYAGTWASNISWLRDSGAYSAGGSAEIDFYGGFKGAIGKSDFGFDVGTLYYWYPGDVNTAANPLNIKADTWEVYGALSWKWISAKLSYSVDNKTFGVRDSSGTYYFDLTATYPVPNTGLSLIAHWGTQKYSGTDTRNPVVGGVIQDNDTVWSYEDWKLGASYALPKDFTIGAFYTDTSGASAFGYGSVSQGGVYPKNIADSQFVVYIQKTF